MSIDLDNVNSGYNLQKINSNFQKVETYINDMLLHRAPTGVAGEAMMGRDLDMNSHSILNAVTGDSPSSLVTKGYVDAADANLQNQLYRALRFTDNIPQATYGVSGRANSLQGYNSLGAPVPIFAQTQTADLAIKLASNDVSLGAALVGAHDVGTVQDRLWDSITIEAFLGQASGNVDDALDLAIAYCVSHNCKVIQLGSGKIYQITRTHNVPDNITFRGDRSNHFSQGSTSYGTTVVNSPANPKDSAFLWYGPTATTWFNCENQVTFDGVVIGAPNQNWAATNKSQLVDYGTSIVAKTNLNVISCVYYGARNFVNATGQSQVFKENVGFAYECDYRINNSRDVNHILNCMSNPGVIRATEAFAKCLIDNTSIFLFLSNHDGTHVSGCMSFGKKIGFKNSAATNYLGNLTIVNTTHDQIGAVLDNQTEGGGFISLNNIMAVGGSASDAGNTTTPDADFGFVILRKTNFAQIATVDISNCYFNLAANPFTTRPPFCINFQTSQAYAVNMNAVECNLPTDNGAGVFCVIHGTVNAAANRHTSDPIRENMIPNAGWGKRHPSNSQPMGWTLVNATVETALSKRVTATATGGYISTAWRQDTAGRTVIVTASSVGSSAGISVLSTDAGGVTTQTDYPWVRKAGKYYASGFISTAARTHELRIYAGNTGSSVVVEYSAMVPGSITSYGSGYNERPPKSTSTGLSSYGVQLAAGGSHAIYPDYAGLAGAYHVYISSALGSYIGRIVKVGPTSTPTITVEDAIYGGANTFTVTWPNNSTPVITTSAAGVLIITLVGATYISDL